MRRTLILCAALCAFSTPAAAGSFKGSAVFGQARCSAVFSCGVLSGDPERIMFGQILGIANGCIAENFNLTEPSGYFEDSYGLDGSGCMTTKKMPRKEGSTLTPHCCVKPSDSSYTSCSLYCTLYAVK